MLRLLVSIVLLGGLVWFLEGERRAGRFLLVDEVFEDFLIANTRERFAPGPGNPGAETVLVVEFREEDAGEYAAWPPEPIDWRIVLEGVRKWEPDVLVIPEVLNWGAPAPEFVGAVGDALAGFPSVVLGVEALHQNEAPAGAPFLGGLESRLPRFGRVTQAAGGQRPAYVKGLVRAPDEAVRAGVELGLVAESHEGELPYTLRLNRAEEPEEWVPTVLAQALSRATRSPYSWQRLRLGPGAGAHLEGGVFVPLTEAGGLRVNDAMLGRVRVINALDLMTGTLAETLSAEVIEAARQAKVVVAGVRRREGDDPRMLAAAVATVLALPRAVRAPLLWQCLVWGVAVAAGLLIIHQGRQRALLKALGLVFAGFTASYLLFDSQMLWFPPAIPATVIMAGGLLGKLIGRTGVKPNTGEGGPAAPEETPAIP